MSGNYPSSLGAFVPAYPGTLQRNVFDPATIPTFTGVNELYGSRLLPLDPAVQSLCIAFFGGFKGPATFLAGTSFAALFALSKRVEDTSFRSRREILCLRLYHLCSLVSFLLSLTTILGSHAAITRLLYPQPVSKAIAAGSIYEILQHTMNFEFLLTRWSFITSNLFFMQCTYFRLLVEFEVFAKKSRRTAGVMVTSAFMGGAFALVGYLESFASPAHWPGLWGMTRELGTIAWNIVETERHPFQIAALACFSITLLSLCKFLLPGSIEAEKLGDNERFI